MTARKRLASQGVHQNLVKGLTNDPLGKWVVSRSKEAEAYITRAALNKQRNLLNRKRRKLVASRQWADALEEARAILRAGGDESAPLHRFVVDVLNKRRKERHKRR